MTHSTNEYLLNIKRQGDPEVSYPLSYVRYHRNPCVIKVILLADLLILIFFNSLNLFWHTDKNFCFYAEVSFWDSVRNDNLNKGTIARLNETRFGPKKKSSPINLDTFWCTGWAWNCQIIFRCASIHGRAGFILVDIELGSFYLKISSFVLLETSNRTLS